MSTYDGNSTPIQTTSDDADDRRSQRARRRIENRRQRHNTRAELHRAAQYPIRKLMLVGA